MNNNQKTLLITGGLGGIGSEIVDFFYKKNFKIIILDNKSNNIFLKIFKSKTKNNNLLIYKKIDLSKPNLIKEYFNQLTNNVIPLFGKFLSKTLVKKLVEKKVKQVYVALDEDAKKDAIKLSKFLMDYGIDTYLLDMRGKDPSELGFTKFWEIVKNTKQSKFSDIIKGRLYA